MTVAGQTDALAQEIRRVDGENSLGAGALAEALMPFIAAQHRREAEAPALLWTEQRDENDRTTYWFAPTPWGRFQIDRPDDHLFSTPDAEIGSVNITLGMVRRARQALGDT